MKKLFILFSLSIFCSCSTWLERCQDDCDDSYKSCVQRVEKKYSALLTTYEKMVGIASKQKELADCEYARSACSYDCCLEDERKRDSCAYDEYYDEYSGSCEKNEENAY